MSMQASPGPRGSRPPRCRSRRVHQRRWHWWWGVAGAFLAGLAGVIATTGTFYGSLRSARTADQGLVAERFKDGVAELGSPDENVQAGGIFTIAGIARSSHPD